VFVWLGMNARPIPFHCLVCARAFRSVDDGLGSVCPDCDWEHDPIDTLTRCECGALDWSAANAQCVGEARWQYRAWLRRSRMARLVLGAHWRPTAKLYWREVQ
jgi:hypothetical protein